MAMGLLTLLLLDVVTPLTWSDIVLCLEEESGFPHEETCPVMFQGFILEVQKSTLSQR